jgi:hypothetical protein
MYVDPGSGMMLFQALMAGIFGALYYFRRFITQAVFRVRGKAKSQ